MRTPDPHLLRAHIRETTPTIDEAATRTAFAMGCLCGGGFVAAVAAVLVAVVFP